MNLIIITQRKMYYVVFKLINNLNKMKKKYKIFHKGELNKNVAFNKVLLTVMPILYLSVWRKGFRNKYGMFRAKDINLNEGLNTLTIAQTVKKNHMTDMLRHYFVCL